MRIALHSKHLAHTTGALVKDLITTLVERHTTLLVSQPLRAQLQEAQASLPAVQAFGLGEDLSNVDLMVSVGGDGTLLEAVNYVGTAAIPILGINAGRMGFLATVAHEDALAAIDLFWQGQYSIDQRALLQMTCTAQGKCIAPPQHPSTDFALNEVALLKRDSSSMIAIRACIDRELHTTYWADGLMVATPTGSTGYSLSCGGPVVLPSACSLVITPINPHNLSVRPLVVPDSAEVSLCVESRNETFLVALDGRSRTTDTEVTLTIRQAPFQAHLVKIGTGNIFDLLRKKLHWGLDVRN
ncbi:MAG: NAD kinase [Bacteroidota bacterium]